MSMTTTFHEDGTRAGGRDTLDEQSAIEAEIGALTRNKEERARLLGIAGRWWLARASRSRIRLFGRCASEDPSVAAIPSPHHHSEDHASVPSRCIRLSFRLGAQKGNEAESDRAAPARRRTLHCRRAQPRNDRDRLRCIARSHEGPVRRTAVRHHRVALGLTEVKDQLRSMTPDGVLRTPRCVSSWINVADRLDPVAADQTLKNDYIADGGNRGKRFSGLESRLSSPSAFGHGVLANHAGSRCGPPNRRQRVLASDWTAIIIKDLVSVLEDGSWTDRTSRGLNSAPDTRLC